MKRAFLLFALLAGGSAFADKQCSPFDKEPDGGSPGDNAACCEGAFNDDGCEPCDCKIGMNEDRSRNVGDPVDTLSGFAWFSNTDVNVQQPWGPPISFVRTYSTHWAQSHGGTDDITALGPGWSHNWADHLVLSGPPPASVVVLRRGDTGTEEHRFDGTRYVARSPNRRMLWDSATSSYTVERPDGSWLIFDVGGQLRTVRSPDGGESQLRYVGEDATCVVSTARPLGALCRVDFLFERSLWFAYDATKRLTQVSWDSAAASPIVKLGFDPAGYLTSFTRADDGVVRFAYGFDHAFPRMPGVLVKLLTLVTDADNTLSSSFRYYQPKVSPSRVVEHETPTNRFQFSYGNWVGKPIRTTKVRSATENLALTWANGRLSSVCELDAAGNCDLARAREITVPSTGVSEATCTRESSGNYTRLERDPLGRLLAEYPGLKSCGPPSAAEALNGREFGHLGSTAIRAFESTATGDSSAPTGFRATTVWDFTQPSVAVDPFCGAMSCLTPGSYNIGVRSDRPQRVVRWGRTLIDEDGTWGTQVQVTRWEYSALGQLVTIDGPRRDLSDLTTRTYFPAGGVPGPAELQQIHRGGRLVFQASNYDPLGNARTTTNENGLVTTKTYDAVGRLLTLLAPGSATPTTWEYSSAGRLLKTTDALGGLTQNRYDPRGRIIAAERITRPPTIDSYRQFGYSGVSPLLSMIDYELGSAVRAENFGYDAQGRKVATQILRNTLAASNAAGVRYAHFDADGRVDWATDEGFIKTLDAATANASRNREYRYDALGRLSEERQRMRGVWVTVGKLTWDARGQLASYTDSRGVKVRYQHDDFSRLVEVESPDLGLFRYVYDEAGNLVKARRPDGSVTRYKYDASNRMIESLAATGLPEVYDWGTDPMVPDCAGGRLPTFQANGRVTHVKDDSGDWYSGYTNAGQLHFQGFVRTGASCAQTIVYEWDRDRLRAVRYPSGARVASVFPAVTATRQDFPTALNLVVGAQTRPLVTGLTFEAGRPSGYVTAAGIKWALRRHYDGAPNDWTLTRQSPALGALGVVRSRKFGHTNGTVFAPRHDNWGNPQEIEELVPAWTQTFTYDDLAWMIGATGPWGTRSYAYLVNGDRRQIDGQAYCYEPGGHRLAQVGAERFRSNPGGALWRREKPDGRATTYCWDNQGRLGSLVDSGGQLSRYIYNHLRQRVAEVWPVNGLRADFRSDAQGRLMSEELPGSVAEEFPRALREYVWVGDQPVAVIRSTRAADGTVTFQNLTWIHGGHLGEPLVETDEFGHVLRNHVFEPLGARLDLAMGPVPSVLATKNPYTFETLDVAAAGARSLRVHIGELQLGSCDAVQIIDSVSSAILGELLPGSPADQWLGPYPTDRVRLQLQSKNCGAGRGFKIIETEAQVGAQSVQTLTLKTAMPYPPAGERFTFNLRRPTYFRLTNITIGTCDAVEARRVGTGEVLWKVTPKTFTGAIWTARLAGDVELGIWGAGCNGVEKKNGFNIVQSLVEEPNPPPTPLGFPGQRITASGLYENWNRFYDPALGRYLQPEPMIQNASYVANRSSQAFTPSIYAYALNSPMAYVDANGLEIKPDKTCGKSVKDLVSKIEESLKTTKDCPCKKLLEDNGIVQRIQTKEQQYVLTCHKGAIPDQGKACGFGEHSAVDVSVRKGCGCFAKTLLHELLHTDPDSIVHSADEKPTKDSSFDIFNQVEACITCDGKVVQWSAQRLSSPR